MQTEIGGAERPTPAPAALGSMVVNGGLVSPVAPLPFSVAPVPRTSPVSAGKMKAMQLGTSKISASGPSAIDALAAEWADETEAEVGTTNAWDGDLMDVNDDADDWSKLHFSEQAVG